MSAELLLSLTQEEIKKPYKFNMTGIRVFSLEEALYHTYYYWKESFYDFLTDEFIGWIRNELGLSNMASKVEGLKSIESTANQLIQFLTVTEYFNAGEISYLKKEIVKWEKQMEWEKLKDMADHFMNKKQPDKAYTYYRKALNYGENISLLNNIGVALMHLEMFPEAANYLQKAYNLDKDNEKIMLNLCEALIYGNDFDHAFKYLKKAERNGEKAHVYYLYAVMCIENKNYVQAADYLNKACELEYDSIYLYKLSEVYVFQKDHNRALKVLAAVKDKDKGWYVKRAEIYRDKGDLISAVGIIEKAVSDEGMNDIQLWIYLARYNREKGDLEKAEKACKKALHIDPDDPSANLEYAKVKKEEGRSRDYSSILDKILNNFKKEYRNIVNY